MKKFNQTFLFIYSMIVSMAFFTTILMGFKPVNPNKARYKELTAERINIVEPDGTLRMVISDRAKLPGIIIHGKETPYDLLR